jgi:hypothetical protein
MTPIKLFCGFDEREAIGYAVFCHSVIRRASRPVEFIPLASMGLPEGSNAFTVSRFLVPWLCDFKGHAIFCDASDMLMDADISELDSLFNPEFAVQVVKHPDYKTRHKTKYRGTSMECPNSDYPRKNWASVMLINCEHRAWIDATPTLLATHGILSELQLRACQDNEIGDLPPEWNCLVDEGQPAGKLLHWTAGIPGFQAYSGAPFAELWHHERRLLETVG